MKQQYVSIISVDWPSGTMVVLNKLKGPPTIVGRVAVPGGKVDPGEAPLMAAQREFKEEAGVYLPLDAFDLVMVTRPTRDVEVNIFMTNQGCLQASPQPEELEKVYHTSILSYLQLKDSLAIPDLRVALGFAFDYYGD